MRDILRRRNGFEIVWDGRWIYVMVGIGYRLVDGINMIFQEKKEETRRTLSYCKAEKGKE